MKTERVVILTGSDKDRVVEIQGNLSIGRHKTNDLQLNDPRVSRRHALIEQTPRGVVIRDLDSGNGTYVGQRRILEYRLSHGDVVSVGAQQLRYESVETPTNAPQSDTHAVETPAPTFNVSADKPTSASHVNTRFTRTEDSKMETKKVENVFQTFFSKSRDAQRDTKLRDVENRLQALYKANNIITSERDINRLFNRVMDQIFSLLPAHNGAILLADATAPDGLRSVCVYAGALPEEKYDGPQKEIVISSTIVHKAFDNGEAVITFDAAGDDAFAEGDSIIAQNITSAMCVPLTYQVETLGVVYVDTRGAPHAFTHSDLEMLVALAAPAAIAIKNAQYVKELEQAFEDTLLVLADTIEMRDHYTVGHTWRVTHFAVAIAREMGWSEEKIREVQMGGVLHDVGKIAVDDAILRKNGKLTDEEYAQIKVHPEKGAQLLNNVENLKPLIPYCLYHHERFDGKGYPYGLAGEEIPIEGRLLAVADTLDALTSNRPYRRGMSPDKAITIIEEGKGTQFDPMYADALIRCFHSGKIHQIMQDYLRADEKSIACPFCSTFIRVPEGTDAGEVFTCIVCHRDIKLRAVNDSYFGELMARGAPDNMPDIASPES